MEFSICDSMPNFSDLGTRSAVLSIECLPSRLDALSSSHSYHVKLESGVVVLTCNPWSSGK